MAFYYLLLGHLIGDFVLQTDKIAENKGRRWEWNLLHVLVVTLCIFVFSYSFGILLLLMALLNGVIHFIMDYYKNEICRILHLSELLGFLIDQLIHIILLYFISLVAIYGNQQLFEVTTTKFLIILALVTYFLAIFTQYVLVALFPGENRRFFEKGEKIFGILSRVYATIVFYLSFHLSPFYLLFLIVVASLFFIQFKHVWSKWMSPLHLVVKLVLDMSVPALCILISL